MRVTETGIQGHLDATPGWKGARPESGFVTVRSWCDRFRVRRSLVTALLVAALGLLVASLAGASPPPTPPCPQVEGWTSAGTFGPIDNGNAVQFQCLYSLPGQPNQLTLDMHWYKPSARDVDVDYTECGRVTPGGSYYAFLWSKSHFVEEEYVVSGGTHDSNAAYFKADQERIRKSALTLLAATETLAKSCTKSSSSGGAKDTQRPTVKVQAVRGSPGSVLVFTFTVADNSPRVDVVLTIYDTRARTKVLFRKDYGKAAATRSGRIYHIRIRVHRAANNYWCLTATDAARNRTTACAPLTVS